MKPVIKCNDLIIGYQSGIICKDINLTINSKDYVCVIGDNGSGKTTLIKTILGLIPPVKGTIDIADDVKIGYLPQQNAVQKIFPTSVKEVVLSGFQNKSGLFYKKDLQAKADETMKMLGIYDIRAKNYAELSGGQQQKTLLARALCASDRLLVLDEPINGLDINTQNDFYDIVEKLNNKGTAVIMISHDKTVLNNNASHVLSVEKDKVVLYSKSDYLKKGNNNDTADN